MKHKMNILTILVYFLDLNFYVEVSTASQCFDYLPVASRLGKSLDSN